jgi:hypothetical protein
MWSRGFQLPAMNTAKYALVFVVGIGLGIGLSKLFDSSSAASAKPLLIRFPMDSNASTAARPLSIVSMQPRGVADAKNVDNQHHQVATSRSSASLHTLLIDVSESTAYQYGLKDSYGVGMDCLRVIYAPIAGVKRYLGVYHHHQKEIGVFAVSWFVFIKLELHLYYIVATSLSLHCACQLYYHTSTNILGPF